MAGGDLRLAGRDSGGQLGAAFSGPFRGRRGRLAVWMPRVRPQCDQCFRRAVVKIVESEWHCQFPGELLLCVACAVRTAPVVYSFRLGDWELL